MQLVSGDLGAEHQVVGTVPAVHLDLRRRSLPFLVVLGRHLVLYRVITDDTDVCVQIRCGFGMLLVDGVVELGLVDVVVVDLVVVLDGAFSPKGSGGIRELQFNNFVKLNVQTIRAKLESEKGKEKKEKERKEKKETERRGKKKKKEKKRKETERRGKKKEKKRKEKKRKGKKRGIKYINKKTTDSLCENSINDGIVDDVLVQPRDLIHLGFGHEAASDALGAKPVLVVKDPSTVSVRPVVLHVQIDGVRINPGRHGFRLLLGIVFRLVARLAVVDLVNPFSIQLGQLQNQLVVIDDAVGG